jgi:cytochrome c biogenesis protein CcmG, thiol:disulfide interchange protein DsbE
VQKRSSKQLIAIVAGLWIGVLMGAAAIAGLIYISNRSSASSLQQAGLNAVPLARLEDGTLASDFKLESVTGQPLQLSDLRGKVVVLNFWATWCKPCIREMPMFQRVQDEHPNFVMLGVDTDETADNIGDFVKNIGLTYPIVLDKDSRVAANFRVMLLPSTFVIDERGMIRFRHFGLMQQEQLEQYLSTLGVFPGEGTATP